MYPRISAIEASRLQTLSRSKAAASATPDYFDR
jgi:hypothetical protein